MPLVIVESPAKSKTLSKYLGSTFNILASYGHVRDLPSKNDSVEPDKNFQMHYQIKDSAAKAVKAIIEQAKKTDLIYMAADPDREGEAIAWNLAEILKGKKITAPIKRATFTEITESAVKEAINNPREIDYDLVHAQQSRLSLDYLVGFHLSPVLWRKLPGSKSAGRVQSVALRLIVERENEIRGFIPTEYWTIDLECQAKTGEKFTAKVIQYKKHKFTNQYPKTREDADEIINILTQDKNLKITDISEKEVKRSPFAPFNTASLQQDASNKLGFSTDRTMKIAQKLYEGIDVNGQTRGLITYMRTDGTTISQDALQSIRSYIKSEFGEKYLPKSPRIYKTKTKNAQESHEAIRPTDITLEPSKIEGQLDRDEFKLYELIWKRALACQTADALYLRQTIDMQDKSEQILARAVGSIVKFDGFLKIYSAPKEDDGQDSLLPTLKTDECVDILDPIEPKQHFTSPKPRYTEASLVKEMEELGIGRPSTYATIIKILQDREYVHIEKRQFHPDIKGVVVVAFLKAFFANYVEYAFTAKLEEELDLISDGKLDKIQFLKSFWQDFNGHVEKSLNTEAEVVSSKIAEFMEQYMFSGNNSGSKKCLHCLSDDIIIKTGKFGVYVHCNKCAGNSSIEKYATGIRFSQEKITTSPDGLIGTDDKDHKIYIKNGKFGEYFESQLEDGTVIKRASIPTFLKNSLTLETAIKLLQMPTKIGEYEGSDISIGIGRYGPYLLHNAKYTSVHPAEKIMNISLEEAIEIINTSGKAKGEAKERQTKTQSKTKEIGTHPKTGEKILVGKSKYGVYTLYKKKFYTMQGVDDVDSVTLDMCLDAIKSA